jgi:hypothetical protein
MVRTGQVAQETKNFVRPPDMRTIPVPNALVFSPLLLIQPSKSMALPVVTSLTTTT